MLDVAMSESGVVRGSKNPLHFGLPPRLKRAREMAGVTVAHTARVSGVRGQTIHNIEQGEQGVAPGIDTVEAIARALGVEACVLAFGPHGRGPFRQKVPGGAGRQGALPQESAAATLPNTAPSFEGVSARLTAARELRGLTRQAMGRLSKTSDTTVRQVEAGRSVPGVDVVEALAAALSVSPCWLAYGVGQGPE